MTLLWTIALGFLICLGCVAWGIFHFLREALDSEDASRIDKINTDEE
ncbi:hypothetical protein J1P26_13180 [Neobacillus sp. MM2021_6]|nr:hypothetical protein [Neobacillus sp. OS1-2]MBO0960652.1 hypothetical protein [Neobacillus sp. MM2021_6]NHC18374.1 hypothetical protein [Bacillus sp. MM2020_4]WML38430.1 hypothetical protein RCG19_14520 [Neobacillus sp. OS1-2]